MYNTELHGRLQSFIESEGNSCSMDIGGITPLYVYRLCGGTVAFGGDRRGDEYAK